MDLDSLTVKQVKQLQSLFKSAGKDEPTHPYQVGQNYFIRTVTHYYTGKLLKVTSKELVLSNAAWIADSGRFFDALDSGKLNEVEPFTDDIIVGRGAVVDAVLWKHDLPTKQK